MNPTPPRGSHEIHIPAIASIIVASLTASETIQASEGRFNKLEDQAETLQDLSRLPVRTVLASMLPPKEFAATVGEPADYDTQESRWTLADSKGAMPGTKWPKSPTTSQFLIYAVSASAGLTLDEQAIMQTLMVRLDRRVTSK